jgi:hypothetical protein
MPLQCSPAFRPELYCVITQGGIFDAGYGPIPCALNPICVLAAGLCAKAYAECQKTGNCTPASKYGVLY